MSKIDDLLKKYCPNGVEVGTLGELGEFYGGLTGKSKEDFKDGNAKFITYMNVYSNLKLNLKTDEKVKISDGEKQHTIEYGDILFTGSSETPDERGMSSVLCDITSEKLYLNSFSFGFRFFDKKLFKPEFTKYLFRSNDLRKQIIKTASGVTRFNVSKERMKKVVIPIPPIEVQKEIAHILDSFTELTAELTARRKQYEYYRDALLSFGKVSPPLTFGLNNEEVRWISMGELFEFKNGLSKGKEFFGRGTPFITFSDVFNHNFLHKSDIKSLVECSEGEKQKLHVGRGDVLFTRTSETAEDVGHSSVMLDDIGDCVFNGFTIRAIPKTKELLPEYCAYCFCTDSFRNYVTKNCAFTTRASLTGSTIAEYKLPVPSLALQKRIANVLGNFDKICSDLNIGLPAEIGLRKKQYEYYRDRILSFDTNVNNSIHGGVISKTR